MKTNPLKDGALTENSTGLGTVTPMMVRRRAGELALMDGRSPDQPSKSDWDQARRELTGEPEADPNEAALETVSGSERGDPVPASTGRKLAVPSSDDEDDEGRSDNERLVEEGVAGAEHDQMLQAARAAASETSREL